MSVHHDTKSAIEAILQQQFSPTFLEVIDDSAAHRGHTAAMERPSAGHFKVSMASSAFDGLNQVKRHRLVYQALGTLMDERIHALSLSLHGAHE